MRVDEISRVLASVLRRTYWRMSAPPEAAAKQLSQPMQMVNAVPAKLDPGWEAELAGPQRGKAAPSEQLVRAQIHSQLIDHQAVGAARTWDSEYIPGNSEERHPDNRFAEGVSASGEQIYSPADHVARTFTPSLEDERLALLIAQQARAAAPGVFQEKRSQDTASGGGFDFLHLASRCFGLALLVICAALLLSY